MGVKISSIIMVILGVFIAKISFENFNQAQASLGGENKVHTASRIQH